MYTEKALPSDKAFWRLNVVKMLVCLEMLVDA